MFDSTRRFDMPIASAMRCALIVGVSAIKDNFVRTRAMLFQKIINRCFGLGTLMH
jgi:hypothetical protein